MQTYYSLQKLPPSIQYAVNLSPASSKVIRKAKVSLRDLLPVTIEDIKNMYDDSAEDQTIRQRWKQYQERRNQKLNILMQLREKVKCNQYDLINRHQRKGFRNKQNNIKDMNSKKSLKKFHSTNKLKKPSHKKRLISQLDQEYYSNYFIPKQQNKKVLEKQNSFSLSQKEFVSDNQKKKQKITDRKNEEIIKKSLFQKDILAQQNQKLKHSPRLDTKDKPINYIKKRLDQDMDQKYRQLKLQQTKQLEKMLQIEINEQQKRDEEMKKVSGKEAVRLSKIHMIERAQIKTKIQNIKKMHKQILQDYKNGVSF